MKFLSRLKIRRLREKQYQLNADRHNEDCIKYRNNRETAEYFERECRIAKQFNSWSDKKFVLSKNSENRQKAESLRSRRERLKDLLEKEDQAYKIECQKLASNNRPRSVQFSSSALNESKTREKRAENSLYRPLDCRRIQSYFVENLPRNSLNSLRVLKDSNRSSTGTKMSIEKKMQRTNVRGEIIVDDVEIENNEKPMTDQECDTKDYDERNDEYKENLRSSRASNLYGLPIEDDHVWKREEKWAHTSSSQHRNDHSTHDQSGEHLPRTRKLHDSHFFLGTENNSHEEGGTQVMPNPKYHDRYANKSLEGTCVGERAPDNEDSVPESDEHENNEKSENDKEHQDEVDHAIKDQEEKEAEEIREEDEESMNDNASSDSRQDQQERGELIAQNNAVKDRQQFEIDREVGAKATAGRSDHRHFESEKSFPWMRMIPGDKNLSEQMFLYLTHNELKERIQDLDNRENHACSKHQWDEALRLRDMKNRLDLARERNLYRRDDLMLDPKIKKIGQAGIEAREKLLKQREIQVTNSNIYSEEAKMIWNQWVIEDKKSVLEDARLIREDLMNQLEENWRSLAVDDKQKITDSFKDKDIVNIALRHENDNSSVFRPASR